MAAWGEGVRSDPHPVISKTNGRIKHRMAAFETTQRDLPRAYLKLYEWGQLSGQGQVKGQILTFLYDEA